MPDLIERHPGRAQAGAFWRRAALAAPPERLDADADRSWDELIARALDPEALDRHRAEAVPDTDDDDPTELLWWWIERMTAADTGIVDRMTWFWHGHLTTSADAVGEVELVRRQLALLRSSCLGSFRDLLHGFVTDGALLVFLDADGSEASNPNENLARELMELFTTGPGHYTQDDVRAAARALAGWRLEWPEDDGDGVPEVVFDRRSAFVAPLIFMGEQRTWDTASIVDRLCDRPATAEHVAASVWAELVGTPLDEGARRSLGAWWSANDLEILPLVEHVLDQPAARSTGRSRPRSGLEWYVATVAATDQGRDDSWVLWQLGQMPYRPPNVGGWPSGEHWLRPGSLVHRATLVAGLDPEQLADRASTVDGVLDACGLDPVSPATRAVVERAGADLDPLARSALRWRLALNAPEFHLT